MATPSRCRRAPLALWLALAAGCAHGGPPAPAIAATSAAAAGEDGCAPSSYRASTGTCVPEAWFCSPQSYAGGAADGCDCDCGAPDPDCVAGAARWCDHAGQPVAVESCEACEAAGPSPAPSP